MPTDRPDACEVVRLLGGTATWGQLVRNSTSHSVRKALASDQLRRIGRGTYALPQAKLVFQAAAAARGLVSHTSAAQHWKLETLNAAVTEHITVPPRARPRPIRGVAMHYSEVDGRDDHNGVTSPLRTVLDCALTMPFPEALAIADSALRRELVTSEELAGAADARPRSGRRQVFKVIEAADGRAANAFESGLRAIVLEAGINSFQPQLPVELPSSTVYLDLGDPDLRIALEADSFTYHGSPEALRRDCRRYDELVRSGWTVLRFAWDHVMYEQDWVAAVVLDTCALRAAAWRSSVF